MRHEHKISLAVWIFLAGCSTSSSPTTATTPSPALASAVNVVQVGQGEVWRQIEVPGELRPSAEAEICSKVSGYLSEVRVDIGDRVTAGQALAVVSVPEMDSELGQAEAEQQKSAFLERANQSRAGEMSAQVQASQAEVARARQQILAAQAARGQAASEVRVAASEWKRFQAIVAEDPGLVPAMQLEQVESRRTVAAARLRQATSSVAESQQILQAAQAKVEQARMRTRSTLSEGQALGAETSARNFSQQRLRQLQNYTILRSPIQGVVTRRLLDVGALVHSSAAKNQPVLVVADVHTLRCQIEVPERESTHLRQGTPVTVRLDALPEDPLTARVTRTSEALDPHSRTLTCQIDLANPSGKLKPGMFGHIEIGLERHAGVLRVPSQAVVREKKNAFVFVAQHGIASKTKVELGFANRQWSEIVKGVSGQASVIVSPPESLLDGSPVTTRP